MIEDEMSDRISSFKEFYPYYLKEHSNSTCRVLHFIGTWLVLVVIAYSGFKTDARWLLLVPVVGYGFAWVGHFFFEKNKPATFKYPLYSLAGDWVMWKDLLTGREKF
jgi:hypothetical protein